MAMVRFDHNGHDYQVSLERNAGNHFSAQIDEAALQVAIDSIDPHTLSVNRDHLRHTVYVVSDDDTIYIHLAGVPYVFRKTDDGHSRHRHGGEGGGHAADEIAAPMPGKILKIFVQEGQSVARNQRLFIVEAMKMENEVKSPREGVVKQINFQENELVSVGEPVVELEPPAEATDI